MLKTKTHSATFLTFFLLLLAGFHAQCQEIRGIVTDLKTGEPMTGATVLIKETGRIQYVQLDGKFIFKNVKPGNYTLETTFANCKNVDQEISVTTGKISNVQGYTGFTPRADVPVDLVYGVTEITSPGKDIGAFQSNGTGNHH